MIRHSLELGGFTAVNMQRNEVIRSFQMETNTGKACIFTDFSPSAGDPGVSTLREQRKFQVILSTGTPVDNSEYIGTVEASVLNLTKGAIPISELSDALIKWQRDGATTHFYPVKSTSAAGLLQDVSLQIHTEWYHLYECFGPTIGGRERPPAPGRSLADWSEPEVLAELALVVRSLQKNSVHTSTKEAARLERVLAAIGNMDED